MFEVLETTGEWHLSKIKFWTALNPQIDMAVIRSSGGDEWRAGISEKYRIRDSVHGLIRFGGSNSDRDRTDLIAWKLLNAAEFQRLRRIRQLGFSDLVFPGATHSRFAHSIGVYHMARRLADIIASQKGREHDAERERVALLAALLHDVGHGPFSHVFESVGQAVGHRRRHEEWSAEIVRGRTEVNRVLLEASPELPKQISALLTESEPKDIYGAIVSSQFDADRLDYIQRDRLMTGVEFGHIDLEWLLDCLEVGIVTVEPVEGNKPDDAPCLYLGPKGAQVAEEYLEARSRLYRMVYMHKTTRAAEKMLEALLRRVAQLETTSEFAKFDPLTRYLTTSEPTLESYLALDDSVVWASLWIYKECTNAEVKKLGVPELANRLLSRLLYKCVDVGVRDKPGGNLFNRFRSKLNQTEPGRRNGNEFLFDDATVAPYKWYNFQAESALNKVLIKT